MNYAFRLSDYKKKHLEWDKCLYYDVETAPWDKQFDNDPRYLDIRRHGLTAFTVFVPSELVPKDIPYEFKLATKQEQKDIKNKTITIDGVQFTVFQYYNDKDKPGVQCLLFDLLDAIAKHLRRTTYLCGFNNDHFDDLIILDRLSKDINRWQYHLPNGKPSKLYTTDLVPWAKAFELHSLAELGEYLGLPKLTGWSTQEEYMEYNIRDTEILVHFVKLLNSLGFYALRPATEARHMISRNLLHALRNRQIAEVTRIFSDQKVSDSIPLFGGRTEPYYAKASNVYYLDINSLYPYVMATFQFPKIKVRREYKDKNKIYATAEIKHLRHTCTPRMQDSIQDYLNDVGLLIRVKAKYGELITPDMLRDYFDTNSPWFGVLFVKIHGIREEWEQYKDQILFYFPFARRTRTHTVFSYDPDAIYCVQFYELNWLCFFDYEIVDAIQYPYHEQLPIADDIRALYDKRKEAKAQGDSMERAYKILLNASYGVLATRAYNKQPITEKTQIEACMDLWKHSADKETITAYDIDTGKEIIIKVEPNAGTPKFTRLIGDPNKRYADNTIPIYGIAITSHGRFTLYSLMLNGILTDPVIADQYRVYYVDTDSIFCSAKLAEQLKDWIGPELGKLKEVAIYPECIFLAPKSYIAFTDTDKPIMHFKGTGPLFVRTVVAQSKTTDIKIYERQALNPKAPQKRYLTENYVFMPTAQPQPGSPTLQQLWDYVQNRIKP